MTVIGMSVATVTASLAAEISLCAVIVYNHRLGRRKWRYNRSIKPAPEVNINLAVSTARPHPASTQTGEIRRQIKRSKLISNRFKVTRQCRTLKNSVVGPDRLPAQTQFGDEAGSPHVTTQTVQNCGEVH